MRRCLRRPTGGAHADRQAVPHPLGVILSPPSGLARSPLDVRRLRLWARFVNQTAVCLYEWERKVIMETERERERETRAGTRTRAGARAREERERERERRQSSLATRAGPRVARCRATDREVPPQTTGTKKTVVPHWASTCDEPKTWRLRLFVFGARREGSDSERTDPR